MSAPKPLARASASAACQLLYQPRIRCLSASVAVARQVPVASGGGASAADGGTGGTIARHAPRVTPSATAKTQMERPMIPFSSPSPMVNLWGTKEIAQDRRGTDRKSIE